MPRVSATSWSCVTPMYLRQNGKHMFETNRRRQPRCCVFFSNPTPTSNCADSSYVAKAVALCGRQLPQMSAFLAVRRAGCTELAGAPCTPLTL